MAKQEVKSDNGMAIASLVLGIVSFTGPGPLTGIPAIIFGVISLKNPTNRGMAIAGIILGSLSVVFVLLFLMFLALIFIIAAADGSYDYPQPMPMYDSNGASSAVEQRI